MKKGGRVTPSLPPPPPLLSDDGRGSHTTSMTSGRDIGMLGDRLYATPANGTGRTRIPPAHVSGTGTARALDAATTPNDTRPPPAACPATTAYSSRSNSV